MLQKHIAIVHISNPIHKRKINPAIQKNNMFLKTVDEYEYFELYFISHFFDSIHFNCNFEWGFKEIAPFFVILKILIYRANI